MSPDFQALRRALGLVVLALALPASLAASDEWLVYIGGGLEPIEGGWVERRGKVIFKRRGGTLVSIPFADVDLPASAFITWQLGGRRGKPPLPALPRTQPETEGEPASPCIGAKVISVRSGETLAVATGDEREIIHLACLDAPEWQHRFSTLGWFGRVTASTVQKLVKPGAELCLTEQTPPQRDGEGHRIVYVTLADGTDYSAAVIGAGLGLLRPRSCARATYYRRLEDRAIAERRGLWGPMGAEAAFAAANHAPAVGAGPPPPSGGAGRG